MQANQFHVVVNNGSLLSGLLEAIQEQAQKSPAESDDLHLQPDTSVTTDLHDASGLHVDPLTSAPNGYNLVERHPTEDIALYARETRLDVHHLIVGGGIVIGSDDPTADFQLIKRLKPEFVHQYITGQMGLPSSGHEPKRYIGVYKTITTVEGTTLALLWAIYNTDALLQARRMRSPGVNDQELLKSISENLIEMYDGVLSAETREELPNEMPNVFM